MEMRPLFGKRVLLTGVCGTIGRELLRQVVDAEAGEIIGLDNNETELYLLSDYYRTKRNVRIYFGDVRDLDTLVQRMKGIDVVLHTAAMKHVNVSEQSPRDAIRTNVLGVQNVIDGAFANGVRRVIFTSSDKAVNPTNVMGTSKLMGERLMTAASSVSGVGGPVFASTRFGNVLGSRGSVIPVFHEQIRREGPVTITDDRMTRFIMSLEESVKLVLLSVGLARGGEVFVTKMPVIRIEDLAKVMIQAVAPSYGFLSESIQIQKVGARQGEKLYEELLNEEEIRRTIELDRYFVIMPAFRDLKQEDLSIYPNLVSSHVSKVYNSAQEEPMSENELRTFLKTHRLLEQA
jgi:FlaA1/EpsC-like NDP-sugar epimerase